MKISRSLALLLAGAGFACLCAPALSQGLRATPQFGGARTAPAAQQGPRAADYIVAVVNSEPITNNEVRARMVRFEQQLAQQGAAMPPRAQLQREVLERLISEKAQLQLAREVGVRADDQMVDQAELTVARQNSLDVAELRRRLAADGINVNQFREDLRNQILLTRLRERELDSRIRVSDAEIDAYLRQADKPAASVTQTHARHILLRPTPQLSEEQARQRLADFKRRVQAGQADFAQLAREHSQDASARNGGDLGWASPGMFVPEFEEALNALSPGQIADPLVSRFGVHLVQLLERRETTLGERQQREVARNLVRERKLDEAYVQWAQDVRGRAYVEYREPPQ